MTDRRTDGRTDARGKTICLPTLSGGDIIKIKLTSFKSGEHINEKGDGPYRGFDYLSLFSDPIDLATWTVILHLSIG